MIFVQIFEGRTRSECVGLFLALLELVRQRRVRAEQEVPFGPIYIFLLDATPIEEPRLEESVLAAEATADAGRLDQQTRHELEEEAIRVGSADPTYDVSDVERPDEEMPPPPEYAEEDENFGPMPEVPELPDDWADRRAPETSERPGEPTRPHDNPPAESPPAVSSGM
jgi:hypothetical protein